MSRRSFLAAAAAAPLLPSVLPSLGPSRAVAAPAAAAVPAAPPPVDPARLEPVLVAARDLAPLRAMIIAKDGRTVAETVFRGPALDRPVNVKSVSKTILATLVGIAIDRGHLEGVDQPVAPLLGSRVPADADPRVRRITVGHLLSMRSGLASTSGTNYGRWTASRDWVAFALSRPFEDEPGGRMIYSTGNSHILATVLTRVTDRSVLSLARDWLGEPLGITVPPWPRDPAGVHFGGNDMELSPRGLARFAAMIETGGEIDGRRVVPAAWIAASFQPKGASRHTGHGYGYGWFTFEVDGRPVRYAWGYGGQMVYVVPDAGVTAVMTSDVGSPSARTGYVRDLHALLARRILPAVQAA
nr:serine hydrolase [Chthonobacter rhizosphaerae]